MKNKSLFVIGPHHYCHSTAALIEGLNKLGIMKVFSNANHNYCKHPVFNLDTQIKVAKMADYVLLAHSALEEKYKDKIRPLIYEVKDQTDIFLDGSDYFHYEDNPDKYQLYLKRELDSTKLNGNFNNVEPFIFAAEDRHFTKTINASHHNLWEGKTDDLVCIMSACEKRPWRFDIMKSLQDAFGHSDKVFIGECREGDNLGETTIDTGGRHHSGYFKKLLRARISVDSRGCGEARQTGRFWESLANGCLVFYQPIEPYDWPYSYIDGDDFIVYNDLNELVEKAKYYIDNLDKAKKIADRGFTKLLRHHTTQQRASQFLSLIEEYL